MPLRIEESSFRNQELCIFDTLYFFFTTDKKIQRLTPSLIKNIIHLSCVF